MTNAEVKALKTGDRITLYDYDRVRKPRVRTGTVVQTHERCGGAFPASGQNEWVILLTADDTFVVESDEYIKCFGFDTHDEAGKRIRGAEFTAPQILCLGGMFAGMQQKP